MKIILKCDNYILNCDKCDVKYLWWDTKQIANVKFLDGKDEKTYGYITSLLINNEVFSSNTVILFPFKNKRV